jgi:hypothetical protein
MRARIGRAVAAPVGTILKLKTMKSQSPLDRFIGAVHRRMVVLRFMECIGIATLVAMLGAGALMARAQNRISLVLGALAIGVFAGIVWAIARIPNRFAAALEADKQLDLADLLATATTATTAEVAGNDLWGRAVVMMAEQRCRSLRPSEIVVARLGIRGWTGIGLVSSVILAMGLVNSGARSIHASSDGSAFVNPAEILRTDANRGWTNASSMRETNNDDRAGIREGRFGETSQVNDSASDSLKAISSSGVGNYGDANGSTGGSARSRETVAVNQTLNTQTVGREAARGGELSGGAGGVNNNSAGTDDRAGVRGGPSQSISSPPWRSGQRPAAREAGFESLRLNRGPDAYRDLVRDYFLPPGEQPQQ